ncbi:MAG: hypothetical protein AB1768_10410 [Pseudomonadota bacterium]
MKLRSAVSVMASLCLSSAHAGPADYVFTPAVGYGEREIDFKSGSWKKGDEDRKTAASIGFGYGATSWWFTELYAKYQKEGSEATKYDALEWENKFQLTEPGKYPLDVGLITEIERPRDRSEGYEFKFGPLFQTEFDKLQLNGNLLFERHYRAETSGPMEMGYQWQAKYRWMPRFEFGLQGFGEIGKWNHWEERDEQSHRAGPAVFGKIGLGGRQILKYNAAYLVATSPAAPDRNFRLQVEYEF